MGDARYGPYYRRLAESDDPAAVVRSMGDAEIVAALAAASRQSDPFLANILATEAINRIHRSTAVAQSVAEGVFAVDARGRITFVNAAAERLLGADRAALVGGDAYEVVEMFDAEGRRVRREDRPTTQALEGRVNMREDVVVRGPGGVEFPARYSSSPIVYSGEVVGAVVTIQDVSERRSRLRQLRESEERHRRLYDESPAMHLTVSADGVLRSVNLQGARLLGYAPGEVVGRPVADLIHPADRIAWRRAFDQVLRGEEAGVLEIRKIRKDGSVLWVHEVARASGDGDVLVVCEDVTRLKDIEHELQDLLRKKEEDELRHASLLRFHPDAVYGLDASGRFTEFNPAAERATGYLASEVLGKPFTPLVAPEDIDRAKANFARVLAGEVHASTYDVVRKDGARRTFRLVGIPAVVDGRIVGAFGIAKVAEDGIEARFRQLVEGLPYPAIAMLDPSGHILSWNRCAEELTGWPAAEVCGRHVGILYSREARDAGGPDEPLRRALAEGTVEEEGWRVRKDGSLFWAKETVLALRDDVGVPQGFIKALREDAARPSSPEATEARARQQAVVAQLGVLALRGIDLRSLMDLAVKSAADTLGVEHADILELSEDGPELELVAGVGWRPGLVGTARVGAGVDTFEGAALVNDGPIVVRDLATETRFAPSPLLEEHGVVSGMTVVVPGRPTERHYGAFGAYTTRSRDFSQDDVNFLQAVANVVASAIHRVRAEADLREANRSLEGRVEARTHELSERNLELEAFSYSASHDLRAPLRGITYLSRMLHEELGPRLSAGEREDLERLARESERLTRLVNDLLALSRVGAAGLEPVDVDLSELAASVAGELVQNEPRAVEVVVTPGLRAHGDPDLLRALLVNLIGNAVKYTRRADAPRVEVGRDAEGFYVRDNGVGFEPERAGRLFVAFHRLHGAEFEGSGIGLATARRIVERHGGTVGASSEGIGRGATFHFTLPAPKGSLEGTARRSEAA